VRTSLAEDYTICAASNYVAKLRADLLSAENLQWLGHIFDLATFPVECCQPHLTGENPPYGMIGGTVETSASVEARYAPLSYPTAGGDQRWSSLPTSS
jgi:hypothetical protein